MQLKALAVKNLGEFDKLPIFTLLFPQHCLYGFTIACCPSMLCRLLGLPLLTPQLTHSYMVPYDLLFMAIISPYSYSVTITISLAVLPLYHWIPN